MGDEELLEVLWAGARAVRAALDGIEDWTPRTARSGQYVLDLIADGPVCALLVGAGLGALSEESGLHHPDREVVVVVDPVDGSTNASRGIPWFATSLCAVDADGPRAALVVNQATGEHFEAVRGGGARRDGVPIRSSDVTELAPAVLALNGVPDGHWGWSQYRALGAAALDLCSVACGRLDGFVDLTPGGALGPWDYLGGLLVCSEAGATVTDGEGRELVVLDPAVRRAPVAGATAALHGALLARRAP